MKTDRIKRMVVLGLLIAIIVVLQMIGSYLRIGPVAISLVLVPIVIGAAVYGPSAGAILGFAFSFIVFINSMNGADAGGHMVFEASPALCAILIFAKGTLAGAAAGWVYKLLEKTNGYLAMLLAAIVCPTVNTGIFLLGMFTVFKDVLQAWANGGNVVIYVLSGLVLLNYVPELAINILCSPAGERIKKAVLKK